MPGSGLGGMMFCHRFHGAAWLTRAHGRSLAEVGLSSGHVGDGQAGALPRRCADLSLPDHPADTAGVGAAVRCGHPARTRTAPYSRLPGVGVRRTSRADGDGRPTLPDAGGRRVRGGRGQGHRSDRGERDRIGVWGVLRPDGPGRRRAGAVVVLAVSSAAVSLPAWHSGWAAAAARAARATAGVDGHDRGDRNGNWPTALRVTGRLRWPT
jgi:hypothetical protein